ncbi:MAG TPA: adenylate kinase [Vicinamibacterales bacterium]|jgi:adenylate kinase
MTLNLVMLGPPGAGKGTQAKRLAVARRIPHISTGDMLREAVAAGTEIGLRARAVMEKGQLVSDEIIVGVVKERLAKADAQSGFVLDGFPRTVPQAVALDAIVAGRDPLVIVDIAVADEELVRRLTSRRVCGQCGANADVAAPLRETPGQPVAKQCTTCGGALTQRADDREEVIRERLRVYTRDTLPLLAYYLSRPTFRSVNGAQALERVVADVAAAVDAAVGAA